jgi:hypothetical protein
MLTTSGGAMSGPELIGGQSHPDAPNIREGVANMEHLMGEELVTAEVTDEIIKRQIERWRDVLDYLNAHPIRYRFENGQPVRNEQYKPLLKNGGKP